MRSAATLHTLARPRHAPRPRRRIHLRLEELEPRNLLSTYYVPAQIQSAYGFNQLFTGNYNTQAGLGQTIAIVDAYDDPNALSDANAFSTQYGLPQLVNNVTFTKATPVTPTNPTGATPAPNVGWSEEISLDVQWAHAIAPAANILLVEGTSNSTSDLLAAVDYASARASVVSMSWGGGEFAGETALDSHFQVPGVTFVASSGDDGAWYGVNWPASSPNVLAVGGTTLNQTRSGTFTETAWSDSTGGYSAVEKEPSYQTTVQKSGSRTTPDVAYDANPSTGVVIYDSYGVRAGLYVIGGTSAGAPQWSALVALADQAHGSALTGYSQVLPTLYSLPSGDFHDITSGSNGYRAGTGYDLDTGRGSPLANLVVPALAGTTAPAAAQKASSSSTGTTSTPNAHQHHPIFVLATPNPIVNVTAIPFAAGPSAVLTSAASFPALSQTPATVFQLTTPPARAVAVVPPVALAVSQPANRWEAIVGAEDPVQVVPQGPGAVPGSPLAPGAARPSATGANVLSPGLGQGLRSGAEGTPPNGTEMPEETAGEVEVLDVVMVGRPASALAALVAVFSGSWALRQEESDESRRGRRDGQPRG